MKIILTQEVTGLGGPGDVVEVKDGYGRNYLLPQQLAILATRGAEKQVAQIRRARDARVVRDLGHAKEIKAQVEGLRVRLSVRAGSGGRLFGSVTASDVVKAVRAAGGPELDKRRLELPGHIKTTGAHKVAARLHPDVVVSIPLEVVAAK
jgi:large subunit ribosomal protein L9